MVTIGRAVALTGRIIIGARSRLRLRAIVALRHKTVMRCSEQPGRFLSWRQGEPQTRA